MSVGDSIYRFPETDLDTPIGRVHVWSTGRDHIGITEAGQGPVMVNNREHTFRLDLHREDKGDFDVKRHRSGAMDLYDILMNRAEPDRRYEASSEAAKRKLAEVMVPYVNTWVDTARARQMLAEAEYKRHAQQVARLESKLTEAQDVLSVLEVQLTEERELEAQAASRWAMAMGT